MREIPITADLRTAVFAIQELTRGRNNAAGEITLEANADETIITDPRISATSRVYLTPISPTAATAQQWIKSVSDGQVVIAHTNTADFDKRFNILIMSRDDQMTIWSPPPPVDYIVMEDGVSNILTESGDNLIME